jgi:predicted glycogen debranching enzyme
MKLDIVSLGPAVTGDLDAALRREWLVTNGLGGYASGTVAGVATRRYHGLLIAALVPPAERTMLIAGLREWAVVRGARAALHAIEFADGSIEGDGYRRLASFRLDGMLPVWRFAFGETEVERRVWMADRANTTFVRYAVVAGDRPVELEITPLLTQRDHHALTGQADGLPPGGPAVRSFATHGTTERVGAWVRGIRHREEEARGLDARSDLFADRRFTATVEPGTAWTVTLTADDDPPPEPEAALAAARARQAGLVRTAGAERAPAVVRQLVLAADQFLVDRAIPAADGTTEAGRTVIAGYPWFTDWGRDTMIALPGLTLATGRAEEAATILRSFARFVRDGLVPNHFPDRAGEAPAYNTADASLWFAVAVHAYLEATGDRGLVRDLLPVLRSILDRHVAGTRFGIGVDPADGLLRAGADGVQLTWMDARVDDWVVTPRRGKPVEIQALWVNALRIVGGWLAEADEPDAREAAAGFAAIADRAGASFRTRFWRPALGYLADVVDGPDGDDCSLRPNQLLALSLTHPLVDGDAARSIVDAVGRELVTPLGLRSVAPSDPAYRRRFQGSRLERDGAYHQGTVWSWLIGPWVDAVVRVTGDRALALSYLAPFRDHLTDGGLGTISECFEPEPPHEPRACIAQAWGVAEVLRTWRRLAGV